ncbi:hypothetical protein F2P81_014180, partial [Scophthalmus maximus]
ADADGAAPHSNPDSHVGGVQERDAGGAAAGLGLCGPNLPVLGSPAALPQEPLRSAAGTPTGRSPTGEPPLLSHPSDRGHTASA